MTGMSFTMSNERVGNEGGEPMMQQSFVREHLNGGGPWSQTSR